jgi:hypothetical protein
VSSSGRVFTSGMQELVATCRMRDAWDVRVGSNVHLPGTSPAEDSSSVDGS